MNGETVAVDGHKYLHQAVLWNVTGMTQAGSPEIRFDFNLTDVFKGFHGVFKGMSE
jgi:hypothetical protein